jgi:hypothetical protein
MSVASVRLIVVAVLVELVRIASSSKCDMDSQIHTGRDRCTAHRTRDNEERGRPTGYLKSGCTKDTRANDASVVVLASIYTVCIPQG